MTKIVVCGDSFCSAMANERNHFSQVLEDHFGFKVVNLARGGMSNVGICFQIKEALTLEPDVIVYDTTKSSRIELIMHDNYDPRLGLKNFIYSYPDESTYGSPHVGNESAAIFSTVENHLKEQRGVKITQAHIDAVKLYHTFLFNEKLKDETDSWMFSHWHRTMLDRGVLPIPLLLDSYPGKRLFEYRPMTMKVYHTDVATQKTVAEEINQIIQNSLDI